MIVDDHKLMREGIRRLLDYDKKINVIAEAVNGVDCIEKLKTYTPDIVILDIDMPEMNGIQTLKVINRKRINRPKVLILTAHHEIDYLFPAFDMGVGGYVLKDVSSIELIRAIHIVYNGGRFIQPSLIPILNSKLIVSNQDSNKIDLLTNRELDILKLVAVGNSNKEVADKLFISERTVKNHLVSIYEKIECEDRTQAAIFCIRNGLVTIHD